MSDLERSTSRWFYIVLILGIHVYIAFIAVLVGAHLAAEDPSSGHWRSFMGHGPEFAYLRTVDDDRQKALAMDEVRRLEGRGYRCTMGPEVELWAAGSARRVVPVYCVKPYEEKP